MVSARWSTPEGFGRERSPLLTANTVARRERWEIDIPPQRDRNAIAGFAAADRRTTDRRSLSHPVARVGGDGDPVPLPPLPAAALQRVEGARPCRQGASRQRARGPRGPGVPVLRATRHRQDDHRPHPRQGPELQERGRRRAVLRVRVVPGGRARHQLRRARARRRLQQRRRRDPRPDRTRLARHPGAPQGVHPRRGAHVVEAGVGGVAEDARRAATARRVRARHHRPAEGDRHHPVADATPPVPSAPGRHDGRTRAMGRRRRRARSAAGGARRRPRPGRRVGPRHVVGARTAGLDRRRRRRRGRPRRVHAGVHRTRPGPCAHRDGARDLARARPAGDHRGARAAPAQRVPVADGARAGDPAVRPGRRDRAACPRAGPRRAGAGDRVARHDDGRDAPVARPAHPGRGGVGAAHQRRGGHRRRRPAGADRAVGEHGQAAPRGAPAGAGGGPGPEGSGDRAGRARRRGARAKPAARATPCADGRGRP